LLRCVRVGLLALMLTLGPAAVARAAPPTADFSSTPSTARVGSPVSFSANASGAGGATIASYSWNFGDGGSSGGGASVSHAYTSTGNKAVTLTVTDNNNESTSVSHDVSVVGLPSAAFTFSNGTPNIGDAVSFDASGSNDPAGSIRSYSWSFGDGGSGSGATPSHAYSSSGDKTVTLTITAGLDGRTASASHTLHVNVPPSAAFVFAAVVDPPTGQDPFTPLIGQTVAFSAQGSSDADGSIASYAWDLGTGSFGGAIPDSFLITSFPTTGTKTVKLRVTDNHGATDVATVTMRINAPPVAAFDFAPTGPQTKDTVTFTSTAGDPDGPGDIRAIAWDLNGDGNYNDATGPSAHAVFLTAGDYTVGMRVTDSGGAPAVTTRLLKVVGPAAPAPLPGTSGSNVVVVSPGGPIAGATLATVASSPPGSTSKSDAKFLPVLAGVRLQIAGSVVGSRTIITTLLVFGPAGAAVKATCRGGGTACPRRAVRGTVAKSGSLRLKRLERSLRAGATIVVTVSKPGFVTRRILLSLRSGQAPKRSEGCLIPIGKTKKFGPCPS
jgi:PKD repeat protein